MGMSGAQPSRIRHRDEEVFPSAIPTQIIEGEAEPVFTVDFSLQNTYYFSQERKRQCRG
jgi:hypothetical protein